MAPKNYPRPRLTEASRVDGVRRRKDAASARLVHVVVVDLHRSADHEFAVALVVHVITQIPNTEDVRERPETVPLVLPEASFKSRTIVVRKHTSPFELVFAEVAHIHIMFPRNVAALALARALEGLARVRRAVGPLEGAGAVDLVPIPLATISSAIFAGQLAVALAVALEPLARVLGTVGIPILAHPMPLAVHHLPLEDLAFWFGAVVVVMSGRGIRNFKVAVDPQHIKMVVDGHALEGETTRPDPDAPVVRVAALDARDAHPVEPPLRN